MNGNPVIILLMSFKISYLQTNLLENILMPESKNFRNINYQLHLLTNKMFKSLSLGPEFTKAAKIQRLLTMHSDLNNIAEKHISIYDDIQNVTSLKGMSNTASLEKVFEDIIREETEYFRNYPSEISETNITIQNNDAFDNGFEDFAKKFLDNITKFSFNDVVHVTNEFWGNKNKKLTNSWRKLRDIKVWKPQISNEDIDTDNDTRRIYKGKRTKIKKYPFLVSIHVLNEFMCAGSIISKDLVLTAATCLQIAYKNLRYRENANSIFVRVGSDYTKRHGDLIPVIEIHIHPGYDPQSLKNNIAMVRIMKRLKFSKKRKIQRIDYDKNGDNVDDDINSVTVLGWGAKDVNEEPSLMQRISVARLNIYDIDECKNIYSSYYVTYKNFCAGFVSKGGGACNRDVGGPGIVSGELVGIISFGPKVCGMADAPTVFTKLVHFANWIDNIINQKPQKTRTTETTKRPLSSTTKILRAFSMPVLTTTDTIHVTENSDLKTTEVIYPDELLILKDILQEIVVSNSSIIDYILYGDVIADESEAKNLLTTTEKVDIYHHPLVNQSIFLIERQKQLFRTIEPMSGDDNDDGDDASSYEETNTGVKILESLVGFTRPLEDKARVRFNVQSNKNPKHTTTPKITNKLKEHVNQNFDESLKTDPQDSSSYYDAGISIEENTPPDYEITTTTKRSATPTKTTTTLKSIKLEDYKNVIFNFNTLRESRNIITFNKNQEEILKKTKNSNNRKTKSDKKIKQDIRHVKNDDKKTRTAINIGMAISDEDFDYYDKRESQQDMRSRDNDKGSIRWRFRSRD